MHVTTYAICIDLHQLTSTPAGLGMAVPITLSHTSASHGHEGAWKLAPAGSRT